MFETFTAAHPTLFSWVILPILIFCARTTDMGLSTLRIVFIAQGRKMLAPLVGFFESLIWLFVIGQVIKHLDNPACLLAYAGGFACGNVVGLTIDRRLAIGRQVIRVIAREGIEPLVAAVKEADFGFTLVDGHGATGPVKILFTVARRRDVPRLVAMVEELVPKAFYSIEDVRQAAEGVFPPAQGLADLGRWRMWEALRKSR
ncbi:MAG: DUF2179 domain-containing protein [Thermoanaerobaculia bacterium]|nr:DUF2179 domain-containing protein [Thermoanaerobaculia bacterium]